MLWLAPLPVLSSLRSFARRLLMEAAARSGVKLAVNSHDQQTSQNIMMLQEIKGVVAETSMEGVFDTVRAAVYKLLPVERVTVLVRDEEAGVLRLIYSSDASMVAVPSHKGIAGAVVTSGTSIVVPDAYADARFDRSVDDLTGYSTRNILAVPVFSEDNEKVVGVLQVLNKKHADSGKPQAFDPSDTVLLEVLASLVSSCVARTEALAASKREQCRSEAMLRFATVLHSNVSTRIKALRATAAAELGTDCDRASMLIVDAVATELYVISNDAAAFGQRLPLSQGVAGECATSGRKIHVSDAYSDSRFDSSLDQHTGFTTRDILALPIRIGTRVVGVLMCLNQRSGGFVAAHEELLQLIAVQVAQELLPQLLEAIAAPAADHHEDDDVEVLKLRSWLATEYSLESIDSNSSSLNDSPKVSPRMLRPQSSSVSKDQLFVRARALRLSRISRECLSTSVLPDGLDIESLKTWNLNVWRYSEP